MTDDPRIPLIEAAIEAFNAQEEGLLGFIHPDAKSRVAEGLGNPAAFRGIEGFEAMMGDWGEAWSENTVELDETELLDDTTALVHATQTAVGAGSGVPVTFGTVFLVVFEDGKAIRFEIHPDRGSAMTSLEGSGGV